MKITHIHNPITEEEKLQVYHSILKIFVLSGGNTEDGKENNQKDNEKRCRVCKTEC